MYRVLAPQLAQNIVEYRNQNGAFKRRDQLKKVARLGDKAYEQAAGFPKDSRSGKSFRYQCCTPGALRFGRTNG
jgi:hypothetical protein